MPIPGVAVNLLQVSVVNMVSYKRHMMGFMRHNELCDCGCGGYCSIHGMLQVAAWQLEALTDGLVPRERHDPRGMMMMIVLSFCVIPAALRSPLCPKYVPHMWNDILCPFNINRSGSELCATAVERIPRS